jgi:hypothetical protein
LLRAWVRLHARGWPATEPEIATAARAAVHGEASPADPPARETDAESVAPARPPRHDSLIEID